MMYLYDFMNWEVLFLMAGMLLIGMVLGVMTMMPCLTRKNTQERWSDKGECKPMATRVKRVSEPLDGSDEWDERYRKQVARQRLLPKL